MRMSFQIFDMDKKKYTREMAENLPVLRAKVGMSQEDLAGLIGVTRQTISAIENKVREMSWQTFLSLLFLFSKNSDTERLMEVMGIYDDNLKQHFSFTNLDHFK